MNTEITTEKPNDLKTGKLPPTPATQYFNPTPVTVLLVPVYSEELKTTGVLTVRRGIEPKKGMLALPGGYLEYEDWRAGAFRELNEETGIESLSLDSIKIFDADSVDSGRKLLIYCSTEPIKASQLKRFIPNEETQELVVVYQAQELAFPSHSKQLAKFLSTLNK